MNNKSQLQSYLIQQKGLYGNEIYLNSNVSGKTNQLRPYINNEKEKELNQYRISINLCKKCDLGYTRKNFVFGIGNPDAFHCSLTPLDANVVAFRPFPDHHAYSNDDVTSLGGWASQQNAELVITTLKDLVKIQQDELDGIPLVAVEIEIDFLVGQERIEKLIDDAVCLETTSSSSRCEACASANGVNTS